MKPLSSPRLLAGLVIALFVLLLGGCLQKHLIWSPDGQQAAVLSDDGLRFCSADGTLSDPATPGVYLVAWLSDSQRLLVARERPAASWAEVASVLGSARSQQIVNEAEALWTKLQQGAPWNIATMDLGEKNLLPRYYLRETHGAELRARLEVDDGKQLTSLEIKLQEIALARRQGERVELGTPIYAGVFGEGERIAELRLAPNQKAVAITIPTAGSKGERFGLVVAALDGTTPPVPVATEVAAYPDWTTDGRALVYIQATNPHDNDMPQFATFQQREVFNPEATLALAENPVDLGGGLFQPFGRIRCLPDGRIIFNATELTLPVSARDVDTEREQLYALDPTRQATLLRLTPRTAVGQLPKMLGFFEPSPDGKTLLIGGTDGEVCLFTLATGAIERIQGETKDQRCQPTWRGPGEFTYLKRTETKDGQPAPSRKFEVVLRKGDQETVLSKSWPNAVLEGIQK